jgi:hypothetical protein
MAFILGHAISIGEYKTKIICNWKSLFRSGMSRRIRVMVTVTVKGVELEKADIESVLDEIDQHGIPNARRSTRYCLVLRNNHYPPKRVLLRAASRKGGKGTGYRGGKSTNKPLQDLGYIVIECRCGNKGIPIIPWSVVLQWLLESVDMANQPGPQPDVTHCPACGGDLRNVPRNEMKTKVYKRKDGTEAPETHTYECTAASCKKRFEINQDR